MAIQLGSAYGKVTLDSSGIKKGVDSGISSLGNLARAGDMLGKTMQKVGGAMTVFLTLPIAAFFKSSVDSAIQAESALAELNAVIKSTGGAAGLTADELTGMAAELQKVTKFSDDQIVLGQSMLLTFTRIGRDVFPLATEAMLNMAEKFGSVDQAAIQLGKALNDPIAGVSALRRVGVQLSDQQEEQIKAFMAVNDIASAQKIILQELEVEFGGLARAAGDTTAGKIAQMTNAFDDLKETVGGALIPLLLPLVEGLTKLFQKFQELTPFQQKMIIGFLAVIALAGPLLVFFGTIVSGISSILSIGTALSGLGITMGGIATGMTVASATITATVIPAVVALGTALLPILIIIAAVAATVVLLAVAWKTNFLGMRDNFAMWVKIITNLWKALSAFLRGDTKAATEYLSEAWQAFVDRFNLAFEKLFGIQNAWQKFTEFLRNALNRTVQYIRDSFSRIDWNMVGKYILMGLANGMLMGIPSLIIAATKAAEAVLSTIKKKLGIASPSAEAMKLGMYTAQGFQQGMNRVSPEDMARSLVRLITSSSTSTQQTIVQHFASGLTMTQARQMIADNNEQLMNTMLTALSG